MLCLLRFALALAAAVGSGRSEAAVHHVDLFAPGGARHSSLKQRFVLATSVQVEGVRGKETAMSISAVGTARQHAWVLCMSVAAERSSSICAMVTDT